MQQDHQQSITEIQGEHQIAITGRGNQIKAIPYENVALQTQQDVYQTQLQRYQCQILDLITNQHVPYANYPGYDCFDY